LKALYKKWITGSSIPQEYVCLGMKDCHLPLSVFIKSSPFNTRIEVTRNHYFLGYKPLIIGISLRAGDILLHDEIQLDFCFGNEVVATLQLKRFQNMSLGETSISFYQGIDGRHHFISPIYQKLNILFESLNHKSSGNVNLPGNLYDQVRIAYCIPRLISLITVFEGSRMNLFPTDLHGVIDNDFYLGSLRIGGEACQQVDRLKKIVISEIDRDQFREAYRLGKRHMQPMTDSSSFHLEKTVSSDFGFPLPTGVGVYRELEYLEHFDVSIHRIFIYRLVNVATVKNINPLVHIHRYYAQWRENRKLETQYLFR
jgi:Flavin reductase like domain